MPDIIAKTDVAVFDRWRRSQLSVTAPGGEDHMDILKRCAPMFKNVVVKENWRHDYCRARSLFQDFICFTVGYRCHGCICGIWG